MPRIEESGPPLVERLRLPIAHARERPKPMNLQRNIEGASENEFEALVGDHAAAGVADVATDRPDQRY